MHDRNAGSSIYPAKTKNVSFSMFVIAPVERKQKVSFLFSCHNFISYPGSLDPPPPSPFSLPSLVVRPCTCILGEYSRWRGGCRAIKRKKINGDIPVNGNTPRHSELFHLFLCCQLQKPEHSHSSPNCTWGRVSRGPVVDRQSAYGFNYAGLSTL